MTKPKRTISEAQIKAMREGRAAVDKLPDENTKSGNSHVPA
jgi:hypothetical protein